MRNTLPPRSQVGVGTLVVFVAMVLVASIAAGVLINTAGILQSQSQATGQDATGQASDRLLVVGQTGAAIEDGSVGVVNLTVTNGPGSDDVDLRDTTVSWVGPGGAYNVVNDEATGGSSDAEFHVTALRDPNDSTPVLDEHDDAMVLTFDLGREDVGSVGAFGERLGPGDQVLITLTTGNGASTTTRLAVPQSLSGKNAVVL